MVSSSKKRKKKIQASQPDIHSTWVPASAVSLACLVLVQLHWTPHFPVAVIPSATLPAALPQHLALCFGESFLIFPSVSTSPLHLCLHTCRSSRSRPHGVGILLPQELLGASQGPCVIRSKPRAWFTAAQHNTAVRGIVNKYMNASSL